MDGAVAQVGVDRAVAAVGDDDAGACAGQVEPAGHRAFEDAQHAVAGACCDVHAVVVDGDAAEGGVRLTAKPLGHHPPHHRPGQVALVLFEGF